MEARSRKGEEEACDSPRKEASLLVMSADCLGVTGMSQKYKTREMTSYVNQTDMKFKIT